MVYEPYHIIDVALRKESVDRNVPMPAMSTVPLIGSLSARRAWIEIQKSLKKY